MRRRDAGADLTLLVWGNPFGPWPTERQDGPLPDMPDLRQAWERYRVAAWRSPLREPDRPPAGAWFDGLTTAYGCFLPDRVPAFVVANPAAARELAAELRALEDLLEGQRWRVAGASIVDDD